MAKRRMAAVLAAAALALVCAPAASAASVQAEPWLKVYPVEVRPNDLLGTGIQDGNCATYSAVTSPGFRAPVVQSGDPNNLWGNGYAGSTPGTYTATATCDGKTVTTRFTVLEYQAPSWYLNPLEVAPGGQIWGGSDRITGCPGGPEGPATSPGFAAPLEWTIGGNFGRFHGETTVITTPGRYTATLKCVGTPVPGTIEFTILGTP